MVQFSESSFRFTDPVRYFKANDPIYYEVDNIPLKQLQENDLWLKDQLSKLEYTQIFNTSNITNNSLAQGRASFSELQPYVNDSDNVVYVRPGRFTARINDVFNLQPLQIISKLSDDPYLDSWSFKTNRDGTLKSILNTFKTQLESNAMGMNGLIERCFTRASRDLNNASQYLKSNAPGYNQISTANTPEIPYPSFDGQLYIYNLAVSSVNSKALENNADGFINSPWHESNFIKKWRGVTRTSVVDIPEELSIEIPSFRQEDFWYVDENGVRQTLNSATQRIDLVFIYAKPVDASAATIFKFSSGSNTPTKIYSPQLGIVRGAGIGISLDNRTYNVNTPLNAVRTLESETDQMIIPNISDELGQNIGFNGVKGSFPSPDDLMNLAPMMSETLSDNDFALLGQSILPIAYVVVKKTAALNPNNTPIINTADVVDIRPFFRTTELTFNERSGLAAAHPQVSVANPVASENYVDLVAKELSNRIELISQGTSTGGGGGGTQSPVVQQIPRIVYSGKIYGGWSTYGPEYVLLKYIKTKYPGIPTNEATLKLREEFFYQVPIQDGLPTWDYSHWARSLLSPNDSIGSKLGDYINYFSYAEQPPTANGSVIFNADAIAYASFPSFIKNSTYGITETNATNRFKDNLTLHWVTKELLINSQQIQWAVDLDVRVQYLNCCPADLGQGGIFTTKERRSDGTVSLGIHVAWQGEQLTIKSNRDLINNTNIPYYNKFSVIPPAIVKNVSTTPNAYQGFSNYGTCPLPSVTFDVIAYPSGWGQNQFLNNRNGNSVITLK